MCQKNKKINVTHLASTAKYGNNGNMNKGKCSGKPKQQSPTHICTHSGWHPRKPTSNIYLGSPYADKLHIGIIRSPENKVMEKAGYVDSTTDDKLTKNKLVTTLNKPDHSLEKIQKNPLQHCYVLAILLILSLVPPARI